MWEGFKCLRKCTHFQVFSEVYFMCVFSNSHTYPSDTVSIIITLRDLYERRKLHWSQLGWKGLWTLFSSFLSNIPMFVLENSGNATSFVPESLLPTMYTTPSTQTQQRECITPPFKQNMDDDTFITIRGYLNDY